MSTKASTSDPGIGRDASELVDRFASFLKASFIYPEAHRRVAETAEHLIEQLEGNTSWIQVRFGADESITVAGRPVTPRSNLVGWVHDIVRRTRIAGVELGPRMSVESLAAFSRKLREVGLKPEEGFDEQWFQRLSGIRPIALVFDGGHEVGGVPRCGSGNPFEPGSAQALVFESMLESEDVQSKAAEVRQRARSLLDQQSEVHSVDLIAEIVGGLSTDVIHDASKSRAALLKVLDDLGASLSVGAERIERSEGALSTVMRSVATKFFSFRAPEVPLSVTDLPQGRPEDEAIVEDMNQLLADIESLPDGVDPDAWEDQTAQHLELFGVYLHRYCHEDDAAACGRIAGRLEAALQAPSSAQLDLLDTYVGAALSDADGGPEGRVVHLLQGLGRGDLLQRSGRLGPDLVAFAFPSFFALFLDSLDLDSGDDLNKLRDAIIAVGRKRFEQHAEALCGEDPDSLLANQRIRKLTALSLHEVLPLIAAIAERGRADSRPMIVRFLRRFDLPFVEALALRAVHPAGSLPAAYLQDLCRVAFEPEGDERLREYSAFLLREYIERVTRPEDLEARLQAIRQLRFVPSTETIALLEQLRGRYVDAFLQRSREQREIRNVASRTLKEILGS